ncbi:MAG: hypothetical protein ACKV2O_16540 [Acidimicrobiales bacterium]
MSPDLSELAEAAVRAAPTRLPRVEVVRARAARLGRQRRRRRAMAMAAVLPVLLLGVVAATRVIDGPNARQVITVGENPAPTNLGSFVWPAPPRPFESFDALVDTFVAEVLRWPSVVRTEPPGSDPNGPRSVTLVATTADPLQMLAAPSQAGWGFVQIGGGLSMVTDGGHPAIVFHAPPATRSSSVEVRTVGGTIEKYSVEPDPGTVVEVPLGDNSPESVLSVLVVHTNRSGLVVSVVGGQFAVPAAVGPVSTVSPVPVQDSAPPAGPAPSTMLGGMVIPAAGPDQSYPFTTLDRWDPEADRGPHSIVVRRTNGFLGDASAVVTYPGQDGGSLVNGRISVRSGGRLWLAAPGPAGRVVARAVGLSAEELTAIVAATTVVNGRPTIVPGPEVAGFTVVAEGSTRPPVRHEARYGCDALGEREALGALCYTGVSTSPGFEDALYREGFQSGPLVGGFPSVVSGVGGGNATLAWELEPGVIAFVGNSGNEPGADQISALHRLAERAQLWSPDQWATSNPGVVAQPNEW